MKKYRLVADFRPLLEYSPLKKALLWWNNGLVSDFLSRGWNLSVREIPVISLIYFWNLGIPVY